MSSIFISFCFIKTISGGDKCVSGTGLYRVNNDVDSFREITFKGFTSNPGSLVTSLEKNSIVLMIGRYVYEENTEYIALIQTVPVSSSENEYVLTSGDLPYSSPLLLFSAPVIQGSYNSGNEGGRESFMLSKRLYNGVTNNKHVPSNVIVSYTNDNNRFTALKNNLQKTILSVIGRLKIGSSKIPHIVASDIEWSYLNVESQSSSTSSNEKSRSHEELDDQLDSIEKKYATLSSQPLQKKPRLSLHSTSAKKPNDNPVSVNFMAAISTIRPDEHRQEPNNVNAEPKNTVHNNSPGTSDNTVHPSTTDKVDNVTPTNNNEPVATTSTNSPLPQNKNTTQARKGLRSLLPLKK